MMFFVGWFLNCWVRIFIWYFSWVKCLVSLRMNIICLFVFGLFSFGDLVMYLCSEIIRSELIFCLFMLFLIFLLFLVFFIF